MKSNNKSVITIILLLLLIAGAVAYYFVIYKNNNDSEEGYHYYAIEDFFVTNVKDSSKLFKTSIIIVTDRGGLDKYLDENEFIIRDTILFILRGLNEDDIKSSTIQDKLREMIPVALNEALGTNHIVSVYFGDFVMQ
jgi:flagellar basal body-associated protein FliL